MRNTIKLNGKKLSEKDIIAMSKHVKTIAFFEKGKNLLNRTDLSILVMNKK